MTMVTHEPHESPWVVTLPLILLAIPSVLIGYFTIQPELFGDFFKDAISSMRNCTLRWKSWLTSSTMQLGNGLAWLDNHIAVLSGAGWRCDSLRVYHGARHRFRQCLPRSCVR